MKRYILIWFVLGICLTSCYEDKGNYNYKDIPMVDSIMGFGSISIGYFDTLILKPEIYISGEEYDTLRQNPQIFLSEEDEFEFSWIFNDGEKTTVLSENRDLEWIATYPSGIDYKLVLSLKSKKTGVDTRTVVTLRVSSVTASGFYVIKTIDGNADIDYFKSDSSLIITDILSETYGFRLSGEARKLSLIANYIYSAPASKGNFLFLLSEKESMVYNYQQGRIQRKMDEMFYFIPNELDFHSAFRATVSDVFYIINSGKVYRVYGVTTGAGIFSNPLYCSHNNEYHISKYSAGYVNKSNPYFFDEKSRTFLYSTNGTSGELYTFTNTENAISTTNMSYDLEYMGIRILASNIVYAYALMKNINNSEYKIFELRLNKNTDPVERVLDIAADSRLISAKFKVSALTLSGLYFIENNVLKSYRLLDGYIEDVEDIVIPDDEEIVFLRQDYYNDSNPALTIGTIKGDKYFVSVYEWSYDSNTGLYTYKGLTYGYEGTGVPADIKPVNRGNNYYNH